MEGEQAMTLSTSLLDAIWDATHDEARAERLAQRWERVIPEMEAAAERIRRQVRESVCRCQATPDTMTADGRCERCYGRRGGAP
jgi:hypothetical protein